MGADKARAEANARRVLALEKELEDLQRSHAMEVNELNTIVGDLRAQQSGDLLDAEVQHAPPAPLADENANANTSAEFAEETAPTQQDVVPTPPGGSPPEESPEKEKSPETA